MVVYLFIFMWLDDVYMVSMGYNYMDQEGDFNFILQLLDGSFEYCLQMFWCFIGSVGFIINNGSFKFVNGNWELMVRVLWGGFIFVEIEYLNYGENQFCYDGFGDVEREVNVVIVEELISVWNFCLGGEYVYD